MGQQLLKSLEGGEIILGNGVNMGLIRSTEGSFEYWSALAGYTGEPLKTALPDTDPKDGKTIERYQFREKGKPELTLLKVIGGKYEYAGILMGKWRLGLFLSGKEVEEGKKQK